MADRKPILTQATVQTDPQLQSYILANYNIASPGQVPSQFTYTPSSIPTSTGSNLRIFMTLTSANPTSAVHRSQR